MLSHERIWAAIDRLAETYDLTPSGLAKRAGLDSTTFNKSKRFASDGRARWPSTESLAKIMEATGISLSEFTEYVGYKGASSHQFVASPDAGADLHQSGFYEPSGSDAYSPPKQGIPVLGLAQAGAGGFFDDAGFPVGEGWSQVELPGADKSANIYALEITGDSMLPLYRQGDIIIVSPMASIKRGDRVVVKTANGEVMAKILKRKNAEEIELSSANQSHKDRIFSNQDVEWIARILWASQ